MHNRISVSFKKVFKTIYITLLPIQISEKYARDRFAIVRNNHFAILVHTMFEYTLKNKF